MASRCQKSRRNQLPSRASSGTKVGPLSAESTISAPQSSTIKRSGMTHRRIRPSGILCPGTIIQTDSTISIKMTISGKLGPGIKKPRKLRSSRALPSWARLIFSKTWVKPPLERSRISIWKSSRLTTLNCRPTFSESQQHQWASTL